MTAYNTAKTAWLNRVCLSPAYVIVQIALRTALPYHLIQTTANGGNFTTLLDNVRALIHTTDTVFLVISLPAEITAYSSIAGLLDALSSIPAPDYF